MTLQIVVSGACDSGQSSELKGQSVGQSASRRIEFVPHKMGKSRACQTHFVAVLIFPPTFRVCSSEGLIVWSPAYVSVADQMGLTQIHFLFSVFIFICRHLSPFA